jgi:HK97 family phage prohead protease
MTIKVKALAPVMEIKEINGETGVFTGYGSVFGKVDSYGDSIAPGAYQASLAEHRKQGTTPKLFWCHDMTQPLGRWLNIVEDGKGLLVEGRLNLKVQRAREAYALLSEGDLDGMSIGYYPVKAAPHPTRRDVTLLEEIKLVEISLVPIGADRFARVNDVKSEILESEHYAALRQKLVEGDLPTIRVLEKGLRDAFSLSNAQAERAARQLFAQGEPEIAEKSAGLDEVLNDLRAIAAGFAKIP